MPYSLQIFEDPEHHSIRTVTIDSDTLFVLVDVCSALDYKMKDGSYWHIAQKLDADERKTVAKSIINGDHSPTRKGGINTPGASLICITESGLYSLIIQSEKPGAKAFKKWITSEVLPSIRKTGGYSTTADASLAQWQPFHDRISLTLTKVPEGYFCLFKEMAELTAQLITQGAIVNDETVPEISPAMAWGKEWELKGFDHEYGPRTKFEHSYPAYYRQARSNPQWVWCYPEEALGVFRRWMRNVYLPNFYPKYLASKEKKGDIPAIIVQAALKAVEASRPKPLR